MLLVKCRLMPAPGFTFTLQSLVSRFNPKSPHTAYFVKASVFIDKDSSVGSGRQTWRPLDVIRYPSPGNEIGVAG